MSAWHLPTGLGWLCAAALTQAAPPSALLPAEPSTSATAQPRSGGDGAAVAANAGASRQPSRETTPLAVERGQWAGLRAGAGMVLVETRVEVLQDGRPGDRVRVRQPGATASVRARVIGSGQLEVAP